MSSSQSTTPCQPSIEETNTYLLIIVRILAAAGLSYLLRDLYQLIKRPLLSPRSPPGRPNGKRSLHRSHDAFNYHALKLTKLSFTQRLQKRTLASTWTIQPLPLERVWTWTSAAMTRWILESACPSPPTTREVVGRHCNLSLLTPCIPSLNYRGSFCPSVTPPPPNSRTTTTPFGSLSRRSRHLQLQRADTRTS